MAVESVKQIHTIRRRAYEPFDLAELGAVTVAEAPTHLYISRRTADGTTAERFYLCSLTAGALLVPLSAPGCVFIASATAETEGNPAGEVNAQALTLWQTAMAKAPFLADPTPGSLAAKAGASLQIAGNDLLISASPIWAFCTGSDLVIETNNQVPSEDFLTLKAAPLGPGWVVRARPGCQVICWPAEIMLEEYGLVVVENVAAVWAQLAVNWLEAEEKRRKAQAAASRALSHRGYQAALEHVASAADVKSQEGLPVEPQQDPLMTALNQIGQSLGITIIKPAADDLAQSLNERFPRIAEESKFRFRLTILNGNWWKEQGVPLLAQEKEGPPLALLPSRSGYCRLDPETGNYLVVDEAFASRLEPRAYTIYATFPQTLSRREIIAFAGFGVRQDAAWLLAAAAAVSLLGLLVPVVTGLIVTFVIPDARFPLLGEMVLILLAVAVGTTMFQIIQGLTAARVNVHLDYRLQPAVWDRVMRLPSQFFRGYGTGDLTLRVLGIETISNTLSGTVVNGILAGLLSLSSFLIMALYDLPLTLFAIAYAVAMALLLGFFTNRQLKWTRKVYFLMGRVENFVLQMLSGIAKLRVAAAEERAFARWANAYADQRSDQTRASIIDNVIQTFIIALPIFGSIGIFLLAGMRAGSINSGAFIAFNAAFGQFTTATIFFTQSILDSLNVVPLYDRVKPVLTAVPEIDADREPPGVLSGEISVRNVCFRYRAEGPMVLESVSFDVQPGQFVAIVGPSGAGKSTILRLLLGFEMPVEGAIFYDDQDLARLDLLRVRRQIGTVLQNVGLIPGSIYDNISGAAAFSREEVMEAVRQAGLAEDIAAMPMGLETLISEGGGNLSGGQKQRLMIARVLVHKPQIIFFDEATSALDNRTQAAVTENLEKFHTTRLVIAHRLSTIRRADKILVVDKGRIVQQGTFADLVGREGLFKKLAERQIV